VKETSLFLLHLCRCSVVLKFVVLLNRAGSVNWWCNSCVFSDSCTKAYLPDWPPLMDMLLVFAVTWQCSDVLDLFNKFWIFV